MIITKVGLDGGVIFELESPVILCLITWEQLMQLRVLSLRVISLRQFSCQFTSLYKRTWLLIIKFLVFPELLQKEVKVPNISDIHSVSVDGIVISQLFNYCLGPVPRSSQVFSSFPSVVLLDVLYDSTGLIWK